MARAVTLIPGDGIGPEVTSAAVDVIAATGTVIDWDVQEVGLPALSRGDEPLPPHVLDSIRTHGVALKGPVSTPAGRQGFKSVNVALRRELDLYAQVRPCRTRPGIASPLGDVDLVVIRETTEDLYAAVEFPAGSPGAATVIGAAEVEGRGVIPPTAGLSIKFTTEAASRRILGFAFRWAEDHGRRKLTVVHKATVMRCTDGVMLDLARSMAADHPTVELEAMQVDALCGQLVRRPADFEVLVMGIQYGDIVSDLVAGIVGGIGTVPGANHGPGLAMFEPAHGTVPHRAGKDEADPLAAMLCAVLLLDHLGEAEAAGRLDRAIADVVRDGDALTADLRRGGDLRPAATTSAMAAAVIAALRPPAQGT
jgi:isocitrate dehydrogenase (NAD+)